MGQHDRFWTPRIKKASENILQCVISKKLWCAHSGKGLSDVLVINLYFSMLYTCISCLNSLIFPISIIFALWLFIFFHWRDRVHFPASCLQGGPLHLLWSTKQDRIGGIQLWAWALRIFTYFIFLSKTPDPGLACWFQKECEKYTEPS